MAELVESLRSLKLHGMAERLPELIDSPRTKMPLQSGLTKLIEAQQVDRSIRGINYQMKVAKFPHHRTSGSAAI